MWENEIQSIYKIIMKKKRKKKKNFPMMLVIKELGILLTHLASPLGGVVFFLFRSLFLLLQHVSDVTEDVPAWEHLFSLVDWWLNSLFSLDPSVFYHLINLNPVHVQFYISAQHMQTLAFLQTILPKGFTSNFFLFSVIFFRICLK